MKEGRCPPSVCHCINARRVAGLITELYDDCLAPAGLTVSQYSLLANLESVSPASISDLAARVGLERTTLVRNLKPLMERGLICDLAEAGRRNRRLELSESGRILLEEARSLRQEAQQEMRERLGEETVQQFKTMLKQLQE